jgi:poly(3-hydroxybutyrate) depolymerase
MSVLSPRRCAGPLAALLTSLALGACAKEPGAALPRIALAGDRVMVAGLSSGAYMATQAHLALSDRIHGAALVAGGPYGCAGGKLETALGTCMKGEPAPDVAALVEQAAQRASSGAIPDLAQLAGDRVFVLHGRRDATVAEPVARAAAAFYEGLREAVPALASLSVSWDGDRDFPHLLPTADGSAPCESAAPYLGNCGYDAAGAIFAALYGAPPRAASTADGTLIAFDQRPFAPAGKATELAGEGRLYLPKACAEGASCGVLIALHGCQQNVETVGEAFVRDAGFNRWADVYGVAVLYPQTHASLAPLNPKACWDWWGYTGADYDTRGGAQIGWLANVLDALKR